jgi:hypothetical protein
MKTYGGIVSFIPRPLYLPNKAPQVAKGKEAGWVRERSGRGRENKTLCSYLESNPGRLARSLVIVLTDISWFMRKLN